MATANVPTDTLSEQEVAAACMTALLESVEDLEQAVTRKGVKQIKDCVIRCRKEEENLLQVHEHLEEAVVGECITLLRGLEDKAVSASAQYYDGNIRDIDALLALGGPQPKMGVGRKNGRKGPLTGPAREEPVTWAPEVGPAEGASSPCRQARRDD